MQLPSIILNTFQRGQNTPCQWRGGRGGRGRRSGGAGRADTNAALRLQQLQQQAAKQADERKAKLKVTIYRLYRLVIRGSKDCFLSSPEI